jgi:outer membrane immunogenic protein
MKKVLLSTVALIGLSAGAFAADLPRRAVAPAPFVAVPVFTWTGFTIGVNLGWAFADDEDATVFVPPGTFAPPFAATSGVLAFGNGSEDGITGGAQIGYNMQFGAFVLGVEADIQAIDFGNGNGGAAVFTTFTGPGLPPGFVAVSNGFGGLDWWGSLRVRAGIAFDRLLVYGTGGFAFGGGGDDGCGAFVGPTVFAGCGDDDWNGGWAAGGGVSFAFTNNLIGSVEGLFVSIDRGNNGGTLVGFTATGVPVAVVGTSGNDTDFGVVRAKLDFKF